MCQALGQAAEIAGWAFVAAVPTVCPVRPLPDHWIACLRYRAHPGETLEVARDIMDIPMLAVDIDAFLQTHVFAANRPVILYYEWYIPTTVIALTLALLRARLQGHSPTLCMLHRAKMSLNRTHATIWVMTRLLRAILGSRHLRLFAENERFVQHYVNWFGQPVQVAPIPFGAPVVSCSDPAWKREVADGQLVCWWPGKPAVRKGELVVRKLVGLTGAGAERLCVVAAASSQLAQVPGGPRVVLVEYQLDRASYLQTMAAADVLLMPYTPDSHSGLTSGILVEAIAAGKVPLVATGTWLADELERFNLEDLIVDWERPDLLAEIARLARDADVRRRLDIMRTAYLAFHSPAGLAQLLRGIQ